MRISDWSSDVCSSDLVRRNNDLEAAFPHLIRTDSPNNQVGAEVEASPLAKVRHAQRMTSIDNAFAAEAVEEFAARGRRVMRLGSDATLALTAEDRTAGPPRSRRYETELLVQAARPDDGDVGEGGNPTP